MVSCQENPLTGWDPGFKHTQIDLSKSTYQSLNTQDDINQLHGVRGRIAFDPSNPRWVWEIGIIGNNSGDDISIYGISRFFAPLSPPLTLASVLPGTVYRHDGSIYGTDKVFTPLSDGDVLTFILDYEDQYLAVAHNGIFQGFMLDPENFVTGSELYPYFATNSNNNGAFLRDGTPLKISSSTSYCLYDPLGSSNALDISFVHEPTAIMAQYDSKVIYKSYYFVINPYLYFNTSQKNQVTTDITWKNIPWMISPYVREDLVPIYWSSEKSFPSIVLSENNSIASDTIIGNAKSNRPATFGKIYWEYEIISGANGISVGISTLDDEINEKWIGYDEKSWGISSGAIHHNNNAISTTLMINDGDRINVAIDIDSGDLWIGVNGVYVNDGDPSEKISPTFTGVQGNIYPAVSSRINTYWEVRGRFVRESTNLPPSSYINIDGTSGINITTRPEITWNVNTATGGELVFDENTIADNDNGNTLTDNDLRVRFDGSAQAYTFSTRSHISGKRYAEFQIINIDDTTESTFIGIGTLPYNRDDILSTEPEKSILYFGSSGITTRLISNYGTDNNNPSPYIVGDIVQLAIDFDSGSVWFGVNGIWDNGDPNIGTSPDWQGDLSLEYFYILIGNQSLSVDGEIRANYGNSTFTFSVPNGYSSWDDPGVSSWDPARKPSQVTLSADKLTASGTVGLYSGLASYGHEIGKYYFEVEVIDTGVLLGNTAMVGVGRFNTNENAFLGSDINSWSIWQLNGSTFNNNTVNNAGATNWISVGDIVQVAVDLNTGSMWFGVNGVWINGSNPGTGLIPRYTNLSGMIFPAYSNDSAGFGDMGSLQVRLSEPFTYEIPSGFDAWDTGIGTVGGIELDEERLTASGNGSVQATHYISDTSTSQIYMEFDINSIDDVTGIGLEVSDPGSIMAHRYWRIKSTTLVDMVDINEIEMFESQEGGVDVTDSIYAISDSEFSTDYQASYAFNNTFSVPDISTSGVRWISENTVGQIRYIGQDFGINNEKNIKRIAIKGGLDSAIEWDVQYSDDGNIWTSVKTNVFVPFNVTIVENVGGEENVERILYQNTGALGLLDKGQSVTFDPLKSSNTWQFFNNNIQVADIGFRGMSQATRSITTGKRYWEIRIESESDLTATIVGFVPPATDFNEYPGQTTGVGWHAGTGNIWVDGTEYNFTSPLNQGDVISFALDLDVGYAWFGVNGVWIMGNPNNNTNPAIEGLSGSWIAAVGDFTSTLTETVAYTANFGQYIYINQKPNNYDDYGPVAGDGTYDTFTAGDVIGIAVDAETKQIWWSKNSNFIQGSAIVNTGTNALLDGNIRVIYETLGGSITANFGQDFFEQSLFRGFEQFGCGLGGFQDTPSITWDTNQTDGLLREQNLRYIQNGAGARTLSQTIGNTRRKYMEFTINGPHNNTFFGILENLIYYNGSLCVGDENFCGPVNYPLLGDGDTVMIAINEISRKGWFGINGVWFNNGFPEIDTNATLMVTPGQEIVFGVVPSGNFDITTNLGVMDFKYEVPFGYESFDSNIQPGLTVSCQQDPEEPQLQSQGYVGHTIGNRQTEVILNQSIIYEPFDVAIKSIVEKTIINTPEISELFPDREVVITSTSNYYMNLLFKTLSSDVIINDGPHAPFSGEILFDELIVGTDVNEGFSRSLQEEPNLAEAIGTASSPLRYSSINIDDIYDYISHFDGHNFSYDIVLESEYGGMPLWPLPTQFNPVMSATTYFNYQVNINTGSYGTLSTSTTPESSVPIYNVASFENTKDIIIDYKLFGLVQPEDSIENFDVSIQLRDERATIRIVYVEPIYADITSGRLQGG